MYHESYYAAPVYESTKSTYTVRYFNAFDVALMKSFDANPEIIDYFQPLMSIIVQMPGAVKELVKIDYWLFFENGLSVWVHVAEPGVSLEAPIFKLAREGCPGKSVFSVVQPPAMQLQEIK